MHDLVVDHFPWLHHNFVNPFGLILVLQHIVMLEEWRADFLFDLLLGIWTANEDSVRVDTNFLRRLKIQLMNKI